MKNFVVAIIIIAVLSITASANSSEFFATTAASRIVVEGTVDFPNAFDVSIYLLKPTYELTNVTESNFKTVVQSIKQAEVTDGKFSTEFLMDNSAETGTYNLYMSAYGMTNAKIATAYYMGVRGQDDFLLTYNTATISQLESLLSEGNSNACKAMGLNISEFVSLPQAVKTRIIDTIISKRTYTKDNISVLFNDLTIAATIENASTTQIDILFAKYRRSIDFSTELDNLITTSKSTGLWSNALVVLANESFLTIDDLKKNITSSVVVARINSSLDYIQITDIIKDYVSTLGISQNSRYWELELNSKRDVSIALFGKSFAKLSDLITAFDIEVDRAIAKPPAVTSGGSGGGGGARPSVQIVATNPQEIAQNITFGDISSVQWAKDAIIFLAQKGIVSGNGDGVFSPNDGVTREQFVKMLVNAAGLSDETAKCDFGDVPHDAWFYKYVSLGVKAGIANGISDNLFGSGQEITRQDVAVMAERLMTISNIKVDISNNFIFADDKDIADYAVEAVKKLTGAGILNGMDNGSFMPYGVCTRAQAAKIIYGIMQKLPPN